jgi:uncharacterized protein YidB (DUF937 family)
MFDRLVNEAASRLSLTPPSGSALVRDLLSLLTDPQTGSAEGFVDLFRRAGLGDAITSWFGRKAGRPITPSELESALGASTIDTLATSSGLTRAAAASASTFLLSRMMGLLTPNGVLSSSTVLSQAWTYLNRPTDSGVQRRIEASSERPAPSGWVPWGCYRRRPPRTWRIVVASPARLTLSYKL